MNIHTVHVHVCIIILVYTCIYVLFHWWLSLSLFFVPQQAQAMQFLPQIFDLLLTTLTVKSLASVTDTHYYTCTCTCAHVLVCMTV